MMLFYFHENYFDPQFYTRAMYHEYLGSIWNGDHSSIPPTSLRLSDGELNRGKRLISDLGIHENYIAIVPGAAWNQKQWPAFKYIELLNKIDIPTLIIVGEEDTGTPVSASEAMKERIPNSQLVVLEQAAHLSNIEQTEAFNEALISFLNGQ